MAIRDFFFTDHAKGRMRQRTISERDVERALDKPEMSYPGRHGETNLVSTIDGRRIRICYVMAGNRKKIITVIQIA